MTAIPTIDFETYSEAGHVWDIEANKWAALPGAPSGKKGLPVVGAAVYATHPSTEVLCLAYSLPDGVSRMWVPGGQYPFGLFQHIRNGGLLEAWNSGFEHWIWNHVCVPRYGWPPLPQRQLRCAMAKARAHALPGSLEKAGEVVGAVQRKSPDGKRLLKKFSMPRQPTAKDGRIRIRPDPADPDTAALYQYCAQDIAAEADISARCPEVEGEELEYWLCDQAINYRGVAIDLVGVENCIAIIDEAHAVGNARLYELTDGAVARASEVAKLTAWLHGQGVYMDSLDEEHVTEVLGKVALIYSPAHEALTIRAAIGSAAVKKTYSMRNQCGPDGRLHDLFSYHAARTGRATGNGSQPTNLPNSGPDVLRCECGRHYGRTLDACPWCGVPAPYWEATAGKPVEWNAAATSDALEVIATRSLDALMYFFGEGLPIISACLRGLFVSAPGKDLICSDYSSIEAVVLAEIAGESWRREVFQTHGRIYEISAAKITGIPFDEAVRHPRRKLGKVAELASGYQGWIGGWKAFGADEFLSDEEIKQAILAWRAASPGIVELWGGQERNWVPERYGCEGMAIQAIQYPGVPQHVFRLDGGYSGVTFQAQGDVLYCRLPSGRCLTYHRPRLRESERRPGTLAISYEGQNTNPKNGPVGWIRMDTWGGRLVENIVQATARDILRRATIALEAAGYPVVLHVYDEIVSEVPEGFGSIEEFERIMGTMPEFAADWPIRAQGGWRGRRYRK
jgi:DNA polymerase bacteriophage-type